VPWIEGEQATGDLARFDGLAGGAISRAIAVGEVKAKPYERSVFLPTGTDGPGRLLVVGAGKAADLTRDRARDVAATAIRALRSRGVTSCALVLRPGFDGPDYVQAIAEGCVLANFDVAEFRTGQRDDAAPVEQVALIAPEGSSAEASLTAAERGRVIGEAQNYARRLSNRPGNLLHPHDLAGEAAKLADFGLDVEVLGPDQLATLGARGILAVGAGSAHPPALVTARYSGAGSSPYLALVGKGVTFDSGGISIKPGENMHEMRGDMTGAASVIAAMRAIATLKVHVNVLGIIATVENLPSGTAYRPGDVITAMSGKTIEVLNTDAEGRIILADAVHYAGVKGATRIVDIATLTGAVMVALGTQVSGVMGTPQPWVDQVMAAAKNAGEKVWQLPLFEEYKEQIKSSIADVANTGGRYAGAITAALFIQEFVPEGAEWVHLDIAGTDLTTKDEPFFAKGPSGVGVRTFVALAESLGGG
jgi:leucyl aminopeptidase